MRGITMKISKKLRLTIVLCIGIFFILIGVGQALFKFEIERKTMNNISMILMVVALFLFFSARSRKSSGDEEEQGGSENNRNILYEKKPTKDDVDSNQTEEE
jgi:uncharacterized membrane protein